MYNLETILTDIGWIGTLLSFIGAYLVSSATNRFLGFIIFIFGDIFLSLIQIYDHIWNQVVILAVFFVMNLIGINTELRNKKQNA